MSPPRMSDTRLTLVADVGGTNTRVALARGTELMESALRRYRNADFTGLEAVLRTHLDAAGAGTPEAACIALAGPVADGAARMTNLDWHVTEAGIARATGAGSAALLNDLQAQGHALPPAAPGAPPRLVIGVGTGFNAVAVHSTPAGAMVTASESGHVGLPITTEAELAFARFMGGGHVEAEDALSGPGLAHLDAWLAAEAGAPGGRDPKKGATGGREAAAVMAALEAGEPRARAACAHFARMLGKLAGDLALVHLPFGGIWLSGGMARALWPWLDTLGFREGFHDKARFSELMARFELHLVTDDYAALKGCAAYHGRLAPG